MSSCLLRQRPLATGPSREHPLSWSGSCSGPRRGCPAPGAAGEVGGSRLTLLLREGWEEARHPSRQVSAFCVSGSFRGWVAATWGGGRQPTRELRELSHQWPPSGETDRDRTQPDQVLPLGALGREATLTVLCLLLQVHHLMAMAGCQVPGVWGSWVIVIAVGGRGRCQRGHSG